MTIAIIGAGMAGLACANALHAAGRSVRVYEKSRGLGGRLATRRDAGAQFDHGAQFVSAREADFRDYLAAAQQSGHADQWRPRCGQERPEDWWAGRPGMSGLVKPLAAGLEIETSARVTGLERSAQGWALRFGPDQAMIGLFDAVVLAVPAPQALDLAGPWLEGGADLAGVELAPCWTVMMSLGSVLRPGLNDVLQPTSGPLSWAARNGSKPGRVGDREDWVLQAGAEWSAAHFQDDAAAVIACLSARFAELAGQDLPAIRQAQAHRWRYARVVRALGEDALWNSETGLGLAGDWCVGPRVEAAWLSGRALARRILG